VSQRQRGAPAARRARGSRRGVAAPSAVNAGGGSGVPRVLVPVAVRGGGARRAAMMRRVRARTHACCPDAVPLFCLFFLTFPDSFLIIRQEYKDPNKIQNTKDI
jgi:hypothetical protein